MAGSVLALRGTGMSQPAARPMVLTLDPLPVATPRVVFDMTRLLLVSRRPFGTGVDRIDLAIGRDLAARFGADCLFAHAAPGGPLLLPHDAGATFLDSLWSRWHGAAAPASGMVRLIAEIVTGHARGLLRAPPWPIDDTVTYVNASHAGLPQRRGGVAGLDPAGRMARLAYIHDLIPIEFPEYHRPPAVARFERFLDGLTAAPVRLLANSADTARRVAAHARARAWPVIDVAPHVPRLTGTAPAPATLRPAVRHVLERGRPYFVVIGTIEPRKNHLLLLHLWRRLAQTGTPPRLVVIGRRGWENEMVLDLLDRSAALAPHVLEFGDLTDAETHGLLAGAHALLMPSFAEGLGLPLMEAGALGVPAIVADLPALREIGAPGTVYLDPLDGPAWQRAILQRAAGAS